MQNENQHLYLPRRKWVKEKQSWTMHVWMKVTLMNHKSALAKEMMLELLSSAILMKYIKKTA